MIGKLYLTMAILSAVCMTASAADVTDSMSPSATAATTVSTATPTGTSLSASRYFPAGRYYGTVAPSLNPAMARQLEKALASIPGVNHVVGHSDDSTIHFTVDSSAHVQGSDIQKIISKTDAGAVVSTPILEQSLTPHPGL